MKLLDGWLRAHRQQRRTEANEANEIRKELRQENTELRLENGRLGKDVDHWRAKYFKLLEEHTVRCAELEALRRTGVVEIMRTPEPEMPDDQDD